MALESQGDPYAIADDTWGSTGLLQIGPRPWIGTRQQLLNPAFNIYKGMDLLSDIQRQTEGDIRRSMALYNCGATGLDADLCGNYGGWNYADRILEEFVPIFRAELTVRAGEDDLIGEWLATLGYDEGLGKWEVMPEEEEEECRIVLPARRFRPRICRR